MKRFISTLLISALCLFYAAAQETYFPVDSLADLVKCLPAPPETGTPAFKYDIARYKWGKEQRKDVLRAEMAKRDAVWTYEALLAEFTESFGLAISKEATPKIWKVLETSLMTVDPIRVAPKAFFHRTRPFVYFNEKTLTGEDDELRGEGSYPSGHTIRSWLVGLLLAEINPDRANEIYARAWAYGESRVIAGAHWQSDVDASRVAASIGFSRLQTSELFHAQMLQAMEEFKKLKK